MISLKNLLAKPADGIVFDDDNTTIKADTMQEFCEDIDKKVNNKVSKAGDTVSGTITVQNEFPALILEDINEVNNDGQAFRLYSNNGGLFFYRMLNMGDWVYDAYQTSDGTFIFTNPPRVDNDPSLTDDLTRKAYVDMQDDELSSRIYTTESGINELETNKADTSYVNMQDSSLDTRLTTAENTLQDKADVSVLQGNYYDKNEFITTSSGSSDAGRPVILNNLGYIDSSMLDITAFEYVAGWNPSGGTEYPDSTGHNGGAFWIVQGVSGDYTFTGGDLNGITTNDGDFIVWNGSNWTHINHDVDPNAYYKLDGTMAITADFQAGGHKLTNAAAATNGSDVPRWDQVVAKSGGTFTGEVDFDGGLQANDHHIRVSNGRLFCQSTTNSSGKRASFYIDSTNDFFSLAIRNESDVWLKTIFYVDLSDYDFIFNTVPKYSNSPATSDTLTNKAYVDGNFVPKTGGTFTGTIFIQGNIITFDSSPRVDLHDTSQTGVGKDWRVMNSSKYLYIQYRNSDDTSWITNTRFHHDKSITFYGHLSCSTSPTSGSHLTNKTYVDTQDNNLSSRITSNDNDISSLNTNKINSVTTGITGADKVTNIVSLTQSEYDNATKNAHTLYIIT